MTPDPANCPQTPPEGESDPATSAEPQSMQPRTTAEFDDLWATIQNADDWIAPQWAREWVMHTIGGLEDEEIDFIACLMAKNSP
jgi:hypothetical protein